MTTLNRITAFLDEELSIDAFDDASHNGLQVANSGKVSRVCCGVDASMEFFREAARRKADLVVCHHGISWGDSLKRITGINYDRIAFLLRNDMALYACHLPLDAHPEHGNNARIAAALGLRDIRPFGLYRGVEIGFEGRLARRTAYDRFKDKVRTVIGPRLQSMDFGPERVRSVAVVSGGGAGEVEEAGRKGVDVYVTGEPALSAYSLAQEYGVNVLFAGHYATEVFGVKSLAALLKKSFDVKTEFVDLDVPY
jgi:dinuclear metal center YbgI/SA1388 family protein